MEIKITIRRKIAKAVPPLPLVCGNSDYVAVFDFDDEWDAYRSKTARVSYGDEYTDIVFVGDKCELPPIADAQCVKIGVYAGDIRTTTPAYIRCLKSITSDEGSPVDPPESVYNQIMEKINSGELNGVDGEKGDPGDDGITPHIGENGNWFLGSEDTGKPSRGEKGDTGDKGEPGSDGVDGTLYITGVAEGTENGSVVVIDALESGTPPYDAAEAAFAAGKEVLLNVTNPAGDWETILRLSKIDYNVRTITFSNSEIIEDGESFPSAEKRLQWVMLFDDNTAEYYYINPEAPPLATPNWSQNDETAKDYIKNRTHWVEPQTVTVIEEMSFTAETDFDEIYSAEVEVSTVTFPTVGEMVTIVFDNETYTMEAKELDGLAAVGNGWFLADTLVNTGEPFWIGFFDDRMLVFTQTGGEHTVSISRVTERVRTLDPKYIKDMYYTEEGAKPLLELDITSMRKMDKSTASGFNDDAAVWGSDEYTLDEVELVIGKEYTVKLNGQSYKLPLVAQWDNSNGCNWIGFGLKNLGDSYTTMKPVASNEVPFVFAAWCDSLMDRLKDGNVVTVNPGWWLEIPYSEPFVEQHIEICDDLIHPLDSKYLPADALNAIGAQPKDFVVQFNCVGDSWNSNKTFAEIQAVYESGTTNIRGEAYIGEMKLPLQLSEYRKDVCAFFETKIEADFLCLIITAEDVVDYEMGVLTDLVDIMTGATADIDGTCGLVPAPAAGDQIKVLTGAGEWANLGDYPVVDNISLTSLGEGFLWISYMLTTSFSNIDFDGDHSSDGLILRSSTEGSEKKFKITVDDSGTLSATEDT